MVLDADGELVCLGPRAGFTDEVPVPLPHGSRGVRRSWVPSLDGFGWGFFFWFFLDVSSPGLGLGSALFGALVWGRTELPGCCVVLGEGVVVVSRQGMQVQGTKGNGCGDPHPSTGSISAPSRGFWCFCGASQ